MGVDVPADVTKAKGEHINPLGNAVEYPTAYSPQLLFPIPRPKSAAPYGYDHWRCYELSWLNAKHVPQCAVLEFSVPSSSPSIVESKSLKLYLGSFSFEQFAHASEILEVIKRDLENLLSCSLTSIELIELGESKRLSPQKPQGLCIDELDSEVALSADVSPSLLEASGRSTTDRSIYSHLFRSLCPVTGQPDFASVSISYSGPELTNESIRAYLVSFRKHQGFHEACCEKIFTDLSSFKHASLSVECFFTRRGGIEINPARFSFSPEKTGASRTSRQ